MTGSLVKVLGFERFGIMKEPPDIFEDWQSEVGEEKNSFFEEQRYRFVDNNGHCGFGFGNKPTVCAPQADSASPTTTHCDT